MESHPCSPSLLFVRGVDSFRTSATPRASSSVSPSFWLIPMQALVTGIHVSATMSPSCGTCAARESWGRAEKDGGAQRVHGRRSIDRSRREHDRTSVCVPIVQAGRRAGVVGYAIRQVARRRAEAAPRCVACQAPRACMQVDSGSHAPALR
jgi:hypothetical protein